MPKAGDRANGRRLIRLLSAGWIPHDQGSSRGFLCLANERGLSCRHLVQDATPASNPYMRGLPTLHALPPALGTDILAAWVSSACVDRNLRQATFGSLAAFGSTSRAMAQMNPTNSRATATIAFGAGLPAAISLR